MKIIVVGAGLIGVSSAYFLAREGFDVTVVEKSSHPAMGTSFANGGQISVCYSEPWASMSNLRKMISWLGKEDSPILFKPSLQLEQWLWGVQFLWQCLPFNNRHNIKELIGLSLYSRNTLQEMRKELGDKLSYNHLTKGILTVYSSSEDFIKGQQDAHFMSQFGCNRIIKNQDEVYAMAPFLKNSQQTIYGADFSPEDESGDARLYCEELTNVCLNMGVKFLFNHEVTTLVPHHEDEFLEAVGVSPVNSDGSLIPHSEFMLNAQAFVLCTASHSTKFASMLGSYLPIYPVKGYSASFNIKDQSLVNDFSMTDSSKKMVFTKIGNQLRVAGTAEFNGFNMDDNPARSQALVERTKQFYDDNAIDFNSPTFWHGLRPTTPNSIPYLRRLWHNVFVNAGHGTLGFTLAAGSGKLLSNQLKEHFKG